MRRSSCTPRLSIITSGSPWRSLFEPDYRVILPDLPGHGLSPLGTETASMETMARAVLRLLDALSIERAIFCGCSIGGYLLYELWRQAPERMRALAICSAKPHADTEETRHARAQIHRRASSSGALARFSMPCWTRWSVRPPRSAIRISCTGCAP